MSGSGTSKSEQDKPIAQDINQVITSAKTFIDKYKSETLIVTLGIIILLLVILFSWIFDRLGLQEKSCAKLNIYYPNLTNQSYFNNSNIIKASAESIFDNSNSILINYHVKSAYNCCCGDGYKNNFVAICALEKSIANGCRFLDFEIYSYNNDPIVASSTANSNFIKETYNALLLSEVLTSITANAFDGEKTTCANDPLILYFRVMSTNLTMLEKMGDIFEEYLDKSTNANFSLLKNYKDASVLSIKMRELYKKIIIICDFNPLPNIIINPKLEKLKNYINLKGKSLYCNTYRYNEIVAKDGNTQFIQDTKRKFTIVLPNLDNSIKNFDSVSSFVNGCHAICMKHQNLDSNLIGYNNEFELDKRFSWVMKEPILLNIVPTPLTSSVGVSLNSYSGQDIISVLTGQFNTPPTTEQPVQEETESVVETNSDYAGEDSGQEDSTQEQKPDYAGEDYKQTSISGYTPDSQSSYSEVQKQDSTPDSQSSYSEVQDKILHKA